MSSRNLLASMMACLLAVGFLGIASVANAASLGPSFLKPGESAGSYVIEIKDRSRIPRTYLPIAPSYQYYDYPYEYSVGRYPTHIGPGFVYFGHPYKPRFAGQCFNRDPRCLAYWGSRGSGPARRLKARRY